MTQLHGMTVWAPDEGELRAIERQVRRERAEAFSGAVRFVVDQIGGAIGGKDNAVGGSARSAKTC